VVTALNAKLTQFPFDREHLDQQAIGTAPPIAQTPATPAPRPATRK
jgi:hypothetical protein